MGLNIFIKVVGFRDGERHALNTLFRLSAGQAVSYSLWTPDLKALPHVALIDMESYESGLELATPQLDQIKLICVGPEAPERAARTFERPLDWPTVVRFMDTLFASDEPANERPDSLVDEHSEGVNPEFKVSLLVGASRDERLYLRARLALAGHTEVEEAATGGHALQLARQRHYDLVIVALDVPDMDGWVLIRQLVTLEPAIGGIVLTTSDTSWHMREHAQACGCRALLLKPFDPTQVVQVLQAV